MALTLTFFALPPLTLPASPSTPPPPPRTTFADLPDELLAHIAALACPPDDHPLAEHWLNTPPLPRDYSGRDVRALRATCRRARAAIKPRPLGIEIRDEWDAQARLEKWASAPDDVLARVRFLRLAPTARPDHPVPPLTALARFELLVALLSRARGIESVELAHNPFCSHDAYGAGQERGFVLARGDDAALVLPALRSLDVALKCRVCAAHMTLLLASWAPGLTRLKCASVTFAPVATTLAPLVAVLACAPLTTIRIKVSDAWDPVGVLAALRPCAATLEEVFVAPYDASRKVQVVYSLSGGGGLDAPPGAEARARWLSPAGGLFAQLAHFPRLKSLDLCLAPGAVVASDEGWREHAEEAAEQLIAACPSLMAGAFWSQVVDLDYAQLKGYERCGWRVGAHGVVVDAARWISPMVNRNQDAQGTAASIPSEEWH
ncbi:hypothetical protein Q8F55_005010 [Vanrija albida]|uniref:F-box domain-containing protein n=1 Tax=Vanrija albida TaxID=181172 RepID=A0ABR3Q0F6_9TREE